MAEFEKEKSMSLLLKDLPMNGEPMKLTLTVAKAAKTGTSKYGEWNLWFGHVTKAPKVYDHENKDKLIENYTGKVSFFPTERLNEVLMNLCDGKVGVEVTIKKTVEEGKKGLVMRYDAEKLSDGKASKDDMTPTELKLVKDTITLKKTGYSLTEKDFVKASQTDSYQGKISEARAHELYLLMQQM